MGHRSLSVRSFLFDDQNSIFRLPLSRSVAMLQDPEANPYAQFAGKRIRGAEVIVELTGRHPAGIVRIVYFILAFDENGVLKKELHEQQAMARYSLYVNAASSADTEDVKVLDAADRFLVSGGQWKPTPVFEARIRDTALGKLKCPRL
jgi:hypothetical protein